MSLGASCLIVAEIIGRDCLMEFGGIALEQFEGA
jgi:hypothetical protein